MSDETTPAPDWYRPASGIPASGIPAKGAGVVQQPGNTTALKRGVYSPRVYGKVAEELRAGLVADFPDLAEPRYRYEVDAWAQAEAQAQLMRIVVASKGIVDEADGYRPRESYVKVLTTLENRAAKHRANLGLDPASEARLVRDRSEASRNAVDINAVLERGRAALAGRETDGEQE